MGRRPWSRVRTDESSTEIQSSTGFTQTLKWTSSQDVRDYDRVALFLNPTALTAGIDRVEIVIAWSDDGTTVPFDADDNFQQSDHNITGFADGSYNPVAYTVDLTQIGGELVANQKVHLVFPVKAGYYRVGVRSVGADAGTYTVRAQRLVF